ncbi:MAG: hypothetical protein A2Z98_12100 [Spirochaetes bacterium GWB1_27_13]|nr:MAG: hypothetical protein A2Z98_12100 [Spirochaetes bacterium GWB1_27_13]
MLKFRNIFLFFLLILIFSNCYSDTYKKYVKSGYAMGSDLTIIFFSKDSKNAQKIMDQCFVIAKELDAKISTRVQNNFIDNLNKNRKLVINDDFTLSLIKESIFYAEKTNGSFDPSLYEIINLWGFESGNNIVPKDSSIKESLKKTGYKNILINDKEVVLKNNISLDLGGIGQGRMVTEISKYLTSCEIVDFLINGSGDLRIGGKFAGERKWKIGIANPYNDSQIIGEIELEDCSIVTSGDYERFFISEDGKRYHHIFDPKTGYPSNKGVHSVTVITKDTTKCDALSTALFVMGEEEALNFTKQNSDVDLILISGDEDNKKISFSDGIKMQEKPDGRYNFFYNPKITNNQ